MKRIIQITVAVFVTIYLLSGIYVVRSEYGERGVVRRFGKVVNDRVEPGIHYHWPFPIERVDKPNVTEIRRMSIGYKLKDSVRGIAPSPEETQFLTGDENIINVRMLVQYIVKEPGAFLFNFVDPHWIVRKEGEAALTRVVGSTGVDSVLTTEKHVVQDRVRKAIQKALDMYGCGIDIQSAQLQEVSPPAEVAFAFKEVASAREDKDKIVNEARGYTNNLIPNARGQAEKMTMEAKAYRVERINMAKGDSARFLSMLAEYRNAKDLTSTRLYIEAMEEILPRLKKYVVDERANRGLDLKFIEMD
ncbi:MAG: FtsH protease activity modulator HflK [Candidatus Tritonobacter lacicola]|nr:FtsH protease activity modulator HflK [Candidatus Tritonobacter lacicola]